MTTHVSDARAGRMPRSQRRAQLLVAAQEVFVEAGYHGAAMDTIADRAGVSKPVLYQHFPSKKELYLALLDRHCDEVVELISAALASTTDNKLRVAAAIGAYFEFFDREGAPFRLVFESDLTGEPEVRSRIDRVGADCAEQIADVIAADTAIGTDEALLLAHALTGAAMNSARHWITADRHPGREEAAFLVNRLLWRGLGGMPRLEAAGADAVDAPA